MKLQVTQENLNRALGSVARVANTRGTLPILANVLIKTSNNRLSISATNLDIAITHYIGAKVANEGSITVPARLMQDFVGSLPAGVINLELKDNKLHVTTDQYQSVVNGIAADDFPVMPAITGGQSWTIKAPALKKALQQIVFAASADETRPVLTGVLLHTFEGKLYLVATDSYRLAEKELGANKTVILSTHIMQEVEALCDRVIIINQGKIIADDKLSYLQQNKNGNGYLQVTFAEPVVETDLLAIGGVARVVAREDHSWQLFTSQVDEVRKNLLQFALINNRNILSLQSNSQSLETIFRELTKGA